MTFNLGKKRSDFNNFNILSLILTLMFKEKRAFANFCLILEGSNLFHFFCDMNFTKIIHLLITTVCFLWYIVVSWCGNKNPSTHLLVCCRYNTNFHKGLIACKN